MWPNEIRDTHSISLTVYSSLGTANVIGSECTKEPWQNLRPSYRTMQIEPAHYKGTKHGIVQKEPKGR